MEQTMIRMMRRIRSEDLKRASLLAERREQLEQEREQQARSRNPAVAACSTGC
jgi:hypothetical protein